MIGSRASLASLLGREQQKVSGMPDKVLESRSAPNLLVLNGLHGRVCDNKLSFRCYCSYYLSQV